MSDWKLDVSMRVVAVPRNADTPEDVIYMLEHFTLEPLASLPVITNSDLAGKNGRLASDGEFVDPILSVPALRHSDVSD
jgi:hypothetical protein